MVEQTLARQRFAARLDEAIRRAGLAQHTFATKMGVSAGTASRWVNQRSEPSIAALVRMARVLGVSLDWLLSVPDAEPPTESEVAADEQTLKLIRTRVRRLRLSLNDLESVLFDDDAGDEE